MITFEKDKNLIKILKNDKRVYTVSENTYAYLNKNGYGSDNIISVIEKSCNLKLLTEDVNRVKDFFKQIDLEYGLIAKKAK